MTSNEGRFGGSIDDKETFLTVFKVHGDMYQHVNQYEDLVSTFNKSAYASLSSSINSLSAVSTTSEKSISDGNMSDSSEVYTPVHRQDQRTGILTDGFESGSTSDASIIDEGSSRCSNLPSIHYKFRLASHHNSNSSDGERIQMFVLHQPGRPSDQCELHDQPEHGQVFDSKDLAIFTTEPVKNSQKATYAIDFSVSHNLPDGSVEIKHIGTAYLHLEPRFSTHGIQRAPIIGTQKFAAIGQIKIEYLIITNPLAYGLKFALPGWLIAQQMDAGHRGSGSGRRTDLPGGLLENTIASFNYAAKHGADMVELDVFVSNDGVPVVYHDFDMLVATSAHEEEVDSERPRVQVDGFTVEQLRQFEVLALHQEDGEAYTLQIPGQPLFNRPFPTLAEVLDHVDSSCCMNIEIKWPQLLQNGKWQASRTREINDFVDKILDCIHNHCRSRRIILSTFDADIAMMLRLKQDSFPVLFLTTGDSLRFNDPRTKTVMNGIHFARAFDLAGINTRSDNINQYLVRYAKDRDLLVYSWGNDINSAQVVKELKRIGLDGLIYDKIDLIKPKD